jgi:hypothetical protein
VNYLQTIPFVEDGLNPVGPGDDLSVMLNRNAVTFEAQFCDERFQTGRLGELKSAGLTV